MNANRRIFKGLLLILEFIAVACGIFIMCAFGSEVVIWKVVFCVFLIMLLDVIVIIFIVDPSIILSRLYALYGCFLSFLYEKLNIHTSDTGTAHRLRVRYRNYSNLYSELMNTYRLDD